MLPTTIAGFRSFYKTGIVKLYTQNYKFYSLQCQFYFQTKVFSKVFSKVKLVNKDNANILFFYEETW